MQKSIEQVTNVTEIIDSLTHPYSSVNDNISKNKCIIDDYYWNILRKTEFWMRITEPHTVSAHFFFTQRIRNPKRIQK